MNEYYTDSQDHLHDELLLIDLLIHAQVIKFRSHDREQNNAFAGLYITEDEIDNLLKGESKYRKWVDESHVAGDEYELISMAVKKLGETIRQKVENSLKQNIELRLVRIARLYQLNSFEVDALTIALAPQFDYKYRKFFSYLHDDVTKKNPTVGLILDILCKTFKEKNRARRSFSIQSPLFKNSILQFIEDPNDPDKPTIEKGVKVDNRIVGYILSDEYMDDNLSFFTRFYSSPNRLVDMVLPKDIHQRLDYFIKVYLNNSISDTFIFSFYGKNGSQKLETAGAICNELGIPLLIVDLHALHNSSLYFERGIDLLLRESRIMNAAIYIDNCDFIFGEEVADSYQRRYVINEFDKYSIISFISSEEIAAIQGEFANQKIINIELPIPEYKQRKQLWNSYLDGVRLDSVDIREIAGKYNLTGGQIKDIITSAEVYAFWRDPMSRVITQRDIEDACHIHSNQKLKKLAQRIKPKHAWDDIVLKSEIKGKLEELVKMFRYKHIIYAEWGFDEKLSLGKGLSALFYGEPGTGKTLAGEIIAYELGMELYKIDISTVVSKYIGETEKNLGKIFDEAESSNAILFFDEADAIFGKRTEVKDSHDRYSNIEVSYLLQRIDEFNGVVIMATNYSSNIDDAFERRIHFSINFPQPDAASRLQIWQNIFPKKSPLSAEVSFDQLAEKLEISGGNIKNIALQAAFYAADEEGDGEKVIAMRHIERACKNEFEKIGRLWTASLQAIK